jgi:zinc transporter
MNSPTVSNNAHHTHQAEYTPDVFAVQLPGGSKWFQYNANAPDTRQKLVDLDVDEIWIDALLATETHPRAIIEPDALLLILRGANLNSGAEPDDMVSIRALFTEDIIITTTVRKVFAIKTIQQRPQLPHSCAQLLAMLLDTLNNGIESVLFALINDLNELEESILLGNHSKPSEIMVLRRQFIRFHRYLLPQKEVLQKLLRIHPALIEPELPLLAEELDRLTHFVEELESAKSRSGLLSEELQHHNDKKLQNTLYILSVITTIFLPLNMVAGLLGMNVGGIPLANNPHGFYMVVFLLCVIILAITMWFKKQKWL